MKVGLRAGVGLIGFLALAIIFLRRSDELPKDKSGPLSRSEEPRTTTDSQPEQDVSFGVLILDAEDRTPVGGARVILKSETGSIQGVTDDSGCYRFRKGARNYTVTAERRGYLEAQTVIRAKEASPLELLLPPIPTITCRFMMGDTPIKVAGTIRVGLTSGLPYSYHHLLEKPVLGDGLEFELAGLNSSSQIKLVGSLRGFAMIPTVVAVTIGRRFHPVTLSVVPAVECQGRVVDERGAGIEDASVYVDHSGDTRNETTTDSAGQFTLFGLSPELLKLAAAKEGYNVARIEVDLVTTRLIELVLTKTSPVLVRGRIVDAGGQPIPDVMIESFTSETRTDKAGIFCLRLSEAVATRDDLFLLQGTMKGYADLKFGCKGVPRGFLELNMYPAGSLAFEQRGSGETKYRLELVSAYGPTDSRTEKHFSSGLMEGFTPLKDQKSMKYEAMREGLLPGLYKLTINPGEGNERQQFVEIHSGKVTKIHVD